MSHFPGYPLLQENQNNYNFERTMHLTPNHHLSKGMALQQQPPPPQGMAPAQTYQGYPPQYQHQVPMMPQAYHQQQSTQYMVAPPQMTTPSQQQQQQQDIAQEWEKIKLARQKLEVLEEKIQVDQELLKQEKRQRRRDRQKATQELHSEWQREVKLLQERSLQIKEEYEANLLAQKQESDAKLEASKKAMGQAGAQEKALQELKSEHAEAIRALNKSLEEEKQKSAQVEEQVQVKHELQLQALQGKLDAKEAQLQNDLKTRQQQWLDKLHAQEQKQQERVEDLKSSMLKEYEVKVVQLQDELEEKSCKTAESEYQQKLAARLSKIQADHKSQMAKLQKELQERDIVIKELETRDHDSHAAAYQIEELNRKLAEKDNIVEDLTRSLEDANAHGVQELAQPSIVQELETQIEELRQLLHTRDIEFKSHAETVASLESNLAEKKKMVSKLENDLLEAAKDRDDQQGMQQVEMFTSLKETLVEREATIEKLGSRVQELEANEAVSKQLHSRLQEREEIVKALEEQIPNLESEHNQRFAALQDKFVDLERSLSDKDETIHCLEEQLSDRDQEQSAALHARETSFQEAQLASESTIKALESQVQDLKEQLEEAKRLYDTEAKEHLLAAKDITIQEMEQQIADLKQERDELIVADMDAVMLNTRLKEKEEAVNRLEAQLLELQQKQSSANQEAILAEKDEALSRLEGQLLELERDLENHKNCHTCQTLREELTETQGKYHTLEAEQVIASSTAEDYLKLRKEMSQLLRKEEQLKVRIETLQQDIQTANKINENLQAQMGEDGSNPNGNISRLRALQRLQLQQNRKQVMEVHWRGSSTVDAGIYTGFINNLGNPDGAGTLKFEDGSVFDGEFRDGNLHGEGVFAWVDGDTYNGEWFEGRQHGYGTFVWADGRLYQGYYKHGQRDGEGLMTWPYGARYKGLYRRDKRNGYGVYNYPDGRVYRGEYKDERPHGVGTETAADGEVIFTGEWVMGEFQHDSTEDI